VRRLLQSGDEAVRQAEARCREWSADRPALVEIALRDVAAAAASANGSGAAEAPFAALEGVLARRGRMAHEVLTGLQQALAGTLERLQRAAPSAHTDVASVKDVTFRGLPAPDLLALRPRLRLARPWWAVLLPGLAERATRRALERRPGAAVREEVGRHDRRVRAWLTERLRSLVESYEAQAELFREQARRASGEGDGPPPARVALELEEDIKALQGAAHEAEAADGHSGGALRPLP